MSKDEKKTEERTNAEDTSVESGPKNAWEEFAAQAGNPDHASYVMHGLLSQTDPRLKEMMIQDYKKLFDAVDIINNMVQEITSTPEGQRQFDREIQKFIERRKTTGLGGENPDE